MARILEDRKWFVVIACTFLLLFASQAGATFPKDAITLGVGFAPGGETDQAARAIAAAAEKILKQPVVIVNRPGGGGSIVGSWLNTQKPDGYNLMMFTPAVVVANLTKDVPFDPLKDFDPIMRFTGFVHSIACLSSKPWKSLADLVADAKSRPDEITIGSPGVGSFPHLAAAEFAMKAGIKLRHVPFQGGAPQLAALLGGHLDVLSGPTVFLPHVESGTVRWLAIYSDRKLENYPDVPRVMDFGYDVAYSSAVGIGAPAGLPENVKEILHQAFKKAMQDPLVGKTLEKLNMPLVYEGPEEYSNTIRTMWETTKVIVDDLGLGVKK